MILIISSNADKSTNEVIDWLKYYNEPFIRVSEDDIIEVKKIEILEGKMEMLLAIKGISILLSEIKFVWYRRSKFGISNKIKLSNELKTFSKRVQQQVIHENNEICRYILHELHTRSLNKQDDNIINKLIVLYKAKEVGMHIPRTLVCDNKKDLLSFIKKAGNVITKNAAPGIFVNYRNYLLNGVTNQVTREIIKILPETFSPMLFQEEISKLIEIRTFYINGKMFSSAIFSQNDATTKVDFRNYNQGKPNRTPPIKLPEPIENKLITLMNNINLNCGSIDLILSTQHKFYFLEVNPVGQFKQVELQQKTGQKVKRHF